MRKIVIYSFDIFVIGSWSGEPGRLIKVSGVENVGRGSRRDTCLHVDRHVPYISHTFELDPS